MNEHNRIHYPALALAAAILITGLVLFTFAAWGIARAAECMGG